MGKVQIIKKSRKEYKCKKCGKVIPVGSTYYKGEINFGPTIVRCKECGLEAWEVTTSDYQLAVGQIVYKWREDYTLMEGVNDDIAAALQEICDDVQDRLDNMPGGLQEGDVGQLLQERIDSLENAISDLESIDIDSMKDYVVTEFVDEFVNIKEDQDEPTWDYLINVQGEDDYLYQMLHSELEEAIDSILSELDV